MRRRAVLFSVIFVAACTSPTVVPSVSPAPSATPSASSAVASPTAAPPLASATVRQITSAGDFPLLSPDGKTVLSVVQGSARKLVFQFIEGAVIREQPDQTAFGRREWLPDSSGVLLELAAGQRAGPLGILPIQGPLLDLGLDYANPALSPDGKWIVAERQEGCCVGITIRELRITARTGGASRTLATTKYPDQQQPISLLGWDASGQVLYRDGPRVFRMALDGATAEIATPPSMRAPVVASGSSPDARAILLCAAQPQTYWVLTDGQISDLPSGTRPAWRTNDPFCGGQDTASWVNGHEVLLRDISGAFQSFDVAAHALRPLTTVKGDAVVAISDKNALVAVGADLRVVSLDTGEQRVVPSLRAADAAASPISGGRFYVRAGTSYYLVQ